MIIQDDHRRQVHGNGILAQVRWRRSLDLIVLDLPGVCSDLVDCNKILVQK